MWCWHGGDKVPSLLLSWPGSWERQHCQPQKETQMGGTGGPPLGSPSPPGCTAHWALHPTPIGIAHVCGAGDSIQDPLGGKRAQHCWVQGQVNWRSDWIRSWEKEGAGWDPGASLLPPSFAGGANFKSLVRLPPAQPQPQPPCCSPSGEAFGWLAGWSRTWRGLRAPPEDPGIMVEAPRRE